MTINEILSDVEKTVYECTKEPAQGYINYGLDCNEGYRIAKLRWQVLILDMLHRYARRSLTLIEMCQADKKEEDEDDD